MRFCVELCCAAAYVKIDYIVRKNILFSAAIVLEGRTEEKNRANKV